MKQVYECVMADDTNLKRKIFALPAALLEQIEDYRYARRIPSEAEAVRRLLRIGLDAEKGAETPATPVTGRTRRKG